MTRLEHRIMNPVLPVSRCNISYRDIVIRIPEIATTFWWGTGRNVFNAEARRRGGNGGKGKRGGAAPPAAGPGTGGHGSDSGAEPHSRRDRAPGPKAAHASRGTGPREHRSEE